MFFCHKNVVIMGYAAKCMFVSCVQVLRQPQCWSQFKELDKQHGGIWWYLTFGLEFENQLWTFPEKQQVSTCFVICKESHAECTYVIWADSYQFKF